MINYKITCNSFFLLIDPFTNCKTKRIIHMNAKIFYMMRILWDYSKKLSMTHRYFPNLPCMASQWKLGDGIRSASCIQSLADNFLIFHNDLPENFCSKKLNFQMNFLDYPKCRAFGLPQSDAYHLQWWTYWAMQCVQQWVLMQVSTGSSASPLCSN